MLVEDDKDFADVVKLSLERLNKNLQISIFNDPNEALTVLDKETFSAIVSDYNMPDINGLKLLTITRNLNITIPFIIFTGFDQAELEEQSFSAGATYFIKKGSNFKESISELNKFLNFIFTQQNKAFREGNTANSNVLAIDFNKNLHLDLIVQNLDCGVYILDLSGKLVYTNKKGALDLGYPSENSLLTDKSSDIFKILDIYNPKYFDFLSKRFNFKTRDDTFSDEMININPGKAFPNEKWLLKKITPIFGDDLALQFVAIITYDMTNIMKNEYESHEELQRSLLLNNCLDLLYHIIDEQNFMDSFCKLLVEKGDYILVWIGSAEIHHNQKIVIPIAFYGFETDYLDNIKITWDAGTKTSDGPVGTAIKTGRPSLFNDIGGDKNFSPWRDDALQRGYHSCLAIPLRLGHESDVLGSLNIYSSKKDAFTEKDSLFLSNLARLLSTGLQILKTGTDLAYDENFNDMPIALIDADIQNFFNLTNEIKKNLVQEDFRAYVENHPGIVNESLKSVKINRLNLKAINLFKSNIVTFEFNPSNVIFNMKNFDIFKEIIISLNEGKKELIRKISIKLKQGGEINAMIKLVLESKSKKFMDHLLIAIITT